MTAMARLALLAVLCGLTAVPPGYALTAVASAAVPTEPADPPAEITAEDAIYPAGRTPRVHEPSRTPVAGQGPPPTAVAPIGRGQAGPISLPVRRHVWHCVWRE